MPAVRVALALVAAVFAAYSSLWAQTTDKFEELFENLGTETSVSPEIDAVEEFAEHPLMLRGATARQLAVLPGFSLPLARRVLRLVKLHADITFAQLADSLRLSPEQAALLETCTTLDGSAPVSGKKSLPTAVWRARTVYRFQETQGLKSGTYLGSAPDVYQRLLLYSENVSGGILTNKDAGESSFADFLSGYAEARTGNFRVIAGDFIVSAGGGGVLWRQFGFRKGAEVIAPSIQYGAGISPYRSSLDFGFFRGGAAAYSFATGDSSSMSVTGFGSAVRRAATVDSSGFATSLKTDGYFRTASEISRRGALPETAIGGIVEFRTATLTATASVLHLNYERPVTSASSSAFSGTEGALFSCSGQWSAGETMLFGEISRDAGGNIGGRLAATFVHSAITATASGRLYSAGFRSPFGYSFGEFSTPGNEYGFYAGAEWRGNIMQFSGYADIYGSLLPRFGMTRPTRGIDLLLENRCKLASGTTLIFRARIEQKNNAFSSPEARTDYTVERFSLRGECSRALTPALQVRLRGEVAQVQSGGVKPDETGVAGFAEAQWQPYSWLKLGGRFAAFSTESFGSALWAFEYALPGMMSNPALFGEGTRAYCCAAITPASWLTARFFYAITAKNGVQSLGSGNEEITGAVDSRLTMQIDAAW